MSTDMSKDDHVDKVASNSADQLMPPSLNDTVDPSHHSAATQPPYIDEHEFNIRLANNDDYDGLTFEVIEAEVAEGKQVVSRGVYLASNLITTLSLLSGFYSILASTQGEFYRPALAIFLSAILYDTNKHVTRIQNAQRHYSQQ